MSKSKSFTLIELLVVIFIIGLLAALVVANVSSSRVKARDAKRKADLNTIQTAVEMYYEKYGTYTIANTGSLESVSNGWFNDVPHPNTSPPRITIAQALINEGFLTAPPIDPSGATTCVGSGAQRQCGYMYFTDGSSYSIYAQLEKPNSMDVATYPNAASTFPGCTYPMNYRIGTYPPPTCNP